MSFRLVGTGWGWELRNALQADPGPPRGVCPFIKHGALKKLPAGHDLRWPEPWR